MDNNKRVILDLSYPVRVSVNDSVTRDKFNGSNFTLKFPTVDDIVDDIKQRKGRILLANINVARAFHYLHVDPADTLKSGLRWVNQYYLDVAITLGSVQSSKLFEIPYCIS